MYGSLSEATACDALPKLRNSVASQSPWEALKNLSFFVMKQKLSRSQSYSNDPRLEARHLSQGSRATGAWGGGGEAALWYG